jgi:hypothetical protein
VSLAVALQEREEYCPETDWGFAIEFFIWLVGFYFLWAAFKEAKKADWIGVFAALGMAAIPIWFAIAFGEIWPKFFD